jgi:hypothetical protein
MTCSINSPAFAGGFIDFRDGVKGHDLSATAGSSIAAKDAVDNGTDRILELKREHLRKIERSV